MRTVGIGKPYKRGVCVMESRVPRPCRHGGCRVLTTEGYCEKHKPTANAGRLSSAARGYGYKWRQSSKLYLAKHPYCAECARQGRRELATEVDHIVPHKGDMKLFWDRTGRACAIPATQSRQLRRTEASATAEACLSPL